MNRSYSELMSLPTFEERFKYLLCEGIIGEETFGWSRYLNQVFYNTSEWKRTRAQIIVRDNGCDLGVADFPIDGRIIVHHINPITRADILNRDAKLFNPENLISVSHPTHEAITYGAIGYLDKYKGYAERTPNDTCPWLK